MPGDISSIPRKNFQNVGNGTTSPGEPVCVTFETQAIRARLECSPYGLLSNISAWATAWDLRDGETWNLTDSPDFVKHGHELGLQSLASTSLFVSDRKWTSLFADPRRLQCCENIIDSHISPGSVGYWSPNLNVGDENTKSFNFTIHGYPIEGYRKSSRSLPLPFEPYSMDDPLNRHLIWTDKPQMAALNCIPIIETANATMKVDADNEQVLEFDILGTPHSNEYAWIDAFTEYLPIDEIGNLVNITTSHGVLFVNGLLGAADTSKFSEPDDWTDPVSKQALDDILENVEDKTFNFRDPGLNVDMMSYSMLSLVGNNHQALLDLTTLERTAQKTFTAMFQHFVHHDLSFDDGGYVYQSLTEVAPDLGPAKIPSTSTPPASPPRLPNFIDLKISQPVELLRISAPAVWVGGIILVYLILTSVAVTIAARKYNKLLPRGIDSVADLAVLIAGGEKLLALAQETSASDSKHDPRSTARLGWFTGDHGEAR